MVQDVPADAGAERVRPRSREELVRNRDGELEEPPHGFRDGLAGSGIPPARQPEHVRRQGGDPGVGRRVVVEVPRHGRRRGGARPLADKGAEAGRGRPALKLEERAGDRAPSQVIAASLVPEPPADPPGVVGGPVRRPRRDEGSRPGVEHEPGSPAGRQLEDRDRVVDGVDAPAAAQALAKLLPEGPAPRHAEQREGDRRRLVARADGPDDLRRDLHGPVHPHQAGAAARAGVPRRDGAGRVQEDALGLCPAPVDADFPGHCVLRPVRRAGG